MSLNIDNTSTVTAGTYQDVLTGISNSDLSSLTGTYGAYSWSLAYDGTNYDLTFTPTRSAYNEIVTNPKFTTAASKFETIRTTGRNSVLTNKLDSFSASQLESYLKKSQGTASTKINTQAFQSQSNFKTALSTITAPKSLSPAGRGPSPIANLTRTNVGNLTLADLKTNELYASIQPANFSSDDKLFNQASNQSSTNVLEFLKSNKNRDLISNDLMESGFFLRTFGSITNYAAINSDDNSYNNDSFGFFGGLQHKIDENLYQGYSLGFSTNKLTLDGGEGNTKTNTIHADIYRKIEEKEYGVTISLGTYISFIDNVRNISETSEILKSSPINSGVDLKLELVKNINLFGLKFYPSVSITGSYGLVQN
ncbi:MAG: autotransporter domain-containing protein, partial [Actinobacteria bacterium]|nr:autotransporter domain-containing protein [Actinomycetota bacterium]